MDLFVHLDGTSAIGQDEPSIFEIIAEEKMHQLLLPAFDYMVAKLTERYYRLIPIYRYKTLIYLILMSGIEFQYLQKWKGSFTESFYGLKRQGKKNLVLNLFEIVGFPLIKSKLGFLN
jgi:peroxin-12